MSTRYTSEELEAMFGLSEKDIEEMAAPWDAGEVVGEPVGPVIVGRPLKFGESLKLVGFKETVRRVKAIDERAASLGLKRSDYLRRLVEQDLVQAGLA